MTVLRVDASIQGPRSASSELADLVEAEWAVARPGAEVVRRHIGASPLPAQAWADAVRARFVPEDERSSAQRAAVALAEEIARELRSAEAAILALPLYNFGVSQHVKTWMDLAIIGGESGERLLDGTPTVVVTTRGGAYGAGLPREGWDHNTAYLRRVIGDVWGADLTLVERELTLVGINPALDAFTETAALMKKLAHEAAVDAGRALARP